MEGPAGVLRQVDHRLPAVQPLVRERRERVFNRMKHHRKAATRHDELDKALPANLQPILIAIHLKNTTKNPIRVNTP